MKSKKTVTKKQVVKKPTLSEVLERGIEFQIKSLRELKSRLATMGVNTGISVEGLHREVVYLDAAVRRAEIWISK